MDNNKTGNRKQVNILEASIGVDIGKYQHVAVAQSWDGRRLKPLLFDNNLQGFNKLWEYRSKAKECLGVSDVRFALEPTGQYWKALAEWLERKPAEVRMVQPAHTHKAKELEDNSPGKHDIKDAGVISDLDIQRKSLKLVRPQGVFAELRYLTICRQGLVKDLNREVNRLHRLMDVLFPELIGLFKNHIGKGLLELVKTAACPDQMVRLGEQAIKDLLKKKSKGTLGLERARAIMNAAGNSIGIREGREALELELRQLLVRMELIRNQLSEIELTINGVIKKVPYIEILSSIPQVGQITLAAILGEAGDFRQYQNARQIIKLAGLNLYEISSGQHHGRKRITKRGRPLLRQMLYLAGLRLIKQKGAFYQFYKRLVEKGKAKPQAIVAMGCKLLRVLFAMVRSNSKFKEQNESPLLIVNQIRALPLIGA